MNSAVTGTALLGGTFNPVHIGHLRLAVAVAEILNLECVALMPCASAPHKKNSGILPYDLRVNMLRTAIEGEPRLAVCTLEAELPAPSYTWNTVAAWKHRYGTAPIFILGDEDFAAIDTWYRGAELLSVMDTVVIPRSGASLYEHAMARLRPDCAIRDDDVWPGALYADTGKGRCCRFLPVPQIELSATDIRKAFLTGKNIRWLVPDAVIDMMNSCRDEVVEVWSREPADEM